MKEFIDKAIETLQDFFFDFWWVVLIIFGVLLILLIVFMVLNGTKAGRIKKMKAAVSVEAKTESAEAKTDSSDAKSADKKESHEKNWAEEAKEEQKKDLPVADEPDKAGSVKTNDYVKTNDAKSGSAKTADKIKTADKDASPESAEKETALKYFVSYDSKQGDWVVKKQGAQRASRRVETKEEAMKIARELSKNQDASLSVLKKDGKFQKTKR